MKKFHGILLLFLLFTSNLVHAQHPFSVINDIPHLALRDPATITAPEMGMIVYSTVEEQPLIYTGTDWETLCTTKIWNVTAEDHFTVKGGISYLPVLAADPANNNKAGTIYYSSANHSTMINNGTSWIKIRDLGGSTFTESKSFAAGVDVKTFKLPVLQNNPSTPGLKKGAFYINALSRSIRYYDGVVWRDLKCIDLPTITTLPVTDITSMTALSGGDITDDGGSPVTARGIRWSVNGDPIDDPSATMTNDGSGVGVFPSSLVGLLSNTTYYVRAYAVNSQGTVYGNLIQFTTAPPVLPVLSFATVSITNITEKSAQGTLNILNNGGALVTDRGFAWSTDRINWTYGSSTAIDRSDVGIFISNLVDLLPGTTYYAKGYATNSVGTIYTSETSFVTSSAPFIVTIKPTRITGIDAFSGGHISNNGGSTVTLRGICWSTEELPTIALITKTEEPIVGDGVGSFSSMLSGLTPGVKYYVRAYAVNDAGLAYGKQETFSTPNYATVATLSASSFFNNTATGGGQVLADGGAEVTSRGVCWSLVENPTIDRSHTLNGTGLGIFSSKLTDLLPNKTYHMRAYATNVVGTVYGADKTFVIIPEIPSVETLAPIAITNISATAGGNITSNGGADITFRGVKWSVKGDPVDDAAAVTTTDGADIGTYQSLLTSLMGNTTYYVRAYATNRNGTAYGELLEFTTLAPQIPVLAGAALTLSNMTFTEITGSIHILNNGGASVVSRGVMYSTDRINYQTHESLTQNPTDLGVFVSNITGLLPGTVYYAKGFANNSAGTAYTKEVSFTTPLYLSLTTTPVSMVTNNSAESGGRIIGTITSGVTFTGICWGTSPNPTIGDDYISGAVSDTFVSKIGGLMGSTKYYVRAYAGNNSTIVYGNEESFVTATSGLATVTTVEIVNATATTGLIKGNVSDNGGSLLTTRGICWNTTGDPTTADQYAADGNDLGDFLVGINGLAPLTKYYVRAYAVNGVGTAYGDELTFTTAAIPTPATVTSLPASGITGFSANSGGDITSDGGSTVTQSGICWSTSALPTTADQHANGSVAIGHFTHALTGLKANTIYYIRAYAINEVGIAYGQIEQFTTAPAVLATLTTKAAQSGAQGVTGDSGGTIINNGGALITEQGLVWSTTAGFNPDTVSTNRISASGADSFNTTITGLKPGTTYYIRAFATNSVGTAYAANEVQFKTFALPLVTTSSIEPATITSMAAMAGGNISDNGGTAVSVSGVCWSTSRNPVLTDGHASGTVGMGSFTNKIDKLLASTTYYVRAYATNSVGTAYGEELSFTTLPAILASITTTAAITTSATAASSGGRIENNGGAIVTTRGLYWSTQPNFNPDTVTVHKTVEHGAFMGSFTAQLSGLKEYTVYYVLAYATNSVGTAYGNLVSFVTPQLATLTTLYTTAIGSTSAISGGDISDEGGSAVYARGVVWSGHADFNPDTVVVNRTSNGSRDGVFTSPLKKLKPNTTYYVRAYATNIAGTSYGNLLSFITNPPVLASLTTKDAIGITGSTAQTGGIITDNGGVEVTTRGLVWSTSPGFRPDTVVNNKTTHAGVGIGSFNSTITNLLPGVTYYIRAYTINSVGIAYGNELSFTTLTVPTLTTNDVSASSLGITAIGGGTIISDGAAAITDQGVVWSTSTNPLLGSAMQTSNDPVTGNTFRSILKSLEPVTVYYVKAYAINSLGTGYGNELTFTTPPVLPTLTTSYITANSNSSAITGGEISKDGGAAITARGVIWSTDRNFNPATVTVSKTQNGTGMGIFTSEVTNLALSTAYYVRAYATNSVGTAYGNQVTVTLFATAPRIKTTEVTDLGGFSANAGGEMTSDGGSDITLKGLCWSTLSNPTINDSKSSNGSGMDAFTATMTNLTPNTLYYVRAYAVNKIGVAYGIERTFITNAFPTLTITTPVTNIRATIATSGGEITNDGRSPILARGVTWNTTGNPTIALAAKTVDNTTTGIGSFVAQLTGLTENTTYYVRAYATNAVGTTYGSQVLFTSVEVTLPLLSTHTPSLIGSRFATSGGEVTYDGGMPVTQRGICWSTRPEPTIDSLTKINHATGGEGTFGIPFTGLAPGTKYYLRAYATNIKGTAYGQEEVFSTPAELPVLSQVRISEITKVSVKATAAVSFDGGSTVTTRGLVWNMTGNPTLENGTLIPIGAGNGSFYDTITGLNEEFTYYVRAYATNEVGTGYSPIETSFSTKICPPTFIVTHIEGYNGAPVTKVVTYNTVRTILSGEPRCWITQNLGADHEATAVTDATEASAGWYWQFNKLQAYKMDGTSRQPNTAFARTISENSDWVPDNDPCLQMLGGGWRLPTGTELTNVSGAPQNWTNYNAAYNSVLKLHNAGLFSYTGEFIRRGTEGYYWSSTQTDATQASAMYFTAGASAVIPFEKSYGWSVRCIGDQLVKMAPFVSDVVVPAATMTLNSAEAQATVTHDGGTAVTAKGLVWNTTGNPTMADHVIPFGSGIGAIAGTLTGLEEGPTYYVRAFATNEIGTTYSSVENSFKICPPTFTVSHTLGFNGAPVTKTVTYKSVSTNISGAARCWITQNLGADQQGTSAYDATETSAGWFWQFNRLQGYKAEGATTIPATGWNTSINENKDWEADNDPCVRLLGGGWRLPTTTEWTNARDIPQNWTNMNMAYNSVLKIHAAGILDARTGALIRRGTEAYFWSGTQGSVNLGGNLYFTAGVGSMAAFDKTYGSSIRCLRDQVVKSLPSVSTVTVPAATLKSDRAEVLSTVTRDGGSPVTAKGLVWNTTGNPTLADQVIQSGSGIGAITGTLMGLSEDLTYYVRAYATNEIGTGYSPIETSFTTKLCPPTFIISHIAGVNGSPVTKMVSYKTAITSLSGAPKCWITQNLGADHQATFANDDTEASAGWFWQFNKLQGYKAEGTIITGTGWIGAINENSDWAPANDPCAQMLGGGWRLPTATEWTNTLGAPQNWANVMNAYNSALKIHGAGFLSYQGPLYRRGTDIMLWSSKQANLTQGTMSFFTNTSSGVGAYEKAYGASVRCISDQLKIAPVISDVIVPAATLKGGNAEAQATITYDGSVDITAKGLVWNTTGNPTLADNVVPLGSGIGAIVGALTGLNEEHTYYVKAFATNSVGTGYSANEASFKVCPEAFTVNHLQGFSGAPVTKTVTYNSINSSVSGAARCWVTQNLGADRQATSANDATEASAGWYWQFNRLQGYKMDVTRTPGATWIGAINENSDWVPANDPCVQMLSGGWRLPTGTELTNARAAPQNWTNVNAGYNSVLKLHAAGFFSYTSAFARRGTEGYYWSSSQTSTGMATMLYFTGSASAAIPLEKTYGWSVRCLRDQIIKTAPVVGDVVVPAITIKDGNAEGQAAVLNAGGAPVTVKGLVWNTTGNPTLADQVISSGSGIGAIIGTLTGLSEELTYYVRAFATNSAGTGYSATATRVSTKVCPPTFTVSHIAGVNGAAATKTVTYKTAITSVSGAPKCWITQNLGADRQATSATDATEASAGWYYQFNKLQGYKVDDALTRTPTAWNGSVNENSDWAPANDPCIQLLGGGWRLPTATELTNTLGAPQNWAGINDAYNSGLKLHAAGLVSYDGTFHYRGQYGFFWSNKKTSNTLASVLCFSTFTSMYSYEKGYAWAVRCLSDEIKTTPYVSAVVVPAATMTLNSAEAQATVTHDGGVSVTAKGLVWNTTGNPTLADNVIPSGVGIGAIAVTLTGLSEEFIYYVKAFATNSEGTSYSAVANFSTKVCPPTFTVVHVAGVNGAPVSKTVTYKTVVSSISGAPKCWITQNLGADQQAISATDATEASAGWYWQFNKLQGYKADAAGTRAPATVWIGSINENSDWAPVNDPCTQMLGGGWRLPTGTELTKVWTTPKSWTGSADGYNSVLKIHGAGYLSNTGALFRRGSEGYLYSSSQVNNTSATMLYFTGTASEVIPFSKVYAWSARCINDKTAN
ncbi:fibrobacter succinogenes major paralogous domain-containing protein [Pedobacter hiemivivus]|uniref:Fibronectin type-III domain-containing protein n=1 Tax=Pedobacter hiemivivus TaxID=2530454 RepID=A0A4R0N7T3_9SPHI|nr:hypothetical protein [Pedobacter hiemivivus]TCC96045.1 hypothetical protein EZ444_13430 [Pedobacter hiemivivus]